MDLALLANLVSHQHREPGGGLVALVVLLVLAAFLMLLDFILSSWLQWQPWVVVRFGLLRGVFRTWAVSTTRTLVGHLAAITRLNLPLAEGLKTAGAAEPGYVGTVLRGVAKRVAAGEPLAEALALVHRSCPPLVISAIAAGTRTSQLSRALTDLERLLDDELETATELRHSARQRWLYPLLMIFVGGLMVTGLMIVVVPKFEEIFSDFDVALPAITVRLISCSDWFMAAAPAALVVLVLLFGTLIVTGLISSMGSDPRRPATPAGVDAWRWIPLITRPGAFADGMSIAIRTLAMALAAGLALPQAATITADLRINGFLRRRWRLFADLIARGVPADQAAATARLGNVFAWACRTLSRGHTSADLVLRHAADHYRAMGRRWWRALADVAWPFIICAIGILVGFIVLALFVPLISLHQSVMEFVP